MFCCLLLAFRFLCRRRPSRRALALKEGYLYLVSDLLAILVFTRRSFEVLAFLLTLVIPGPLIIDLRIKVWFMMRSWELIVVWVSGQVRLSTDMLSTRTQGRARICGRLFLSLILASKSGQYSIFSLELQCAVPDNTSYKGVFSPHRGLTSPWVTVRH